MDDVKYKMNIFEILFSAILVKLSSLMNSGANKYKIIKCHEQQDHPRSWQFRVLGQKGLFLIYDSYITTVYR